MPIEGKLYLWGERAKYVPEEMGVYALYDKNRILIYIGGSSNLRETFSRYQETNFSDDPRKREAVYYRRMSTSNWEETVKKLLDEYNHDYGDIPKLNNPLKPEEKVTPEWGFYFYEAFNKPLFEAAFNLEDLKKKIGKVPVTSLEFHQNRGDFARWIRDVFKETQLAERIAKTTSTGEDLRLALLNALGNPEVAECPECETLSKPVKTWQMAGRPSKAGERLQLTIALYKCENCGKTYRNVIKKEKIKA
ncbi:MAG: GIY-YIG nuclease family protein [Candidatus Bathyarchaeum sp.]|nr:MAG: GIY-YIG nuclease family protein [Candidatus Bathyarchaeum sp.]